MADPMDRALGAVIRTRRAARGMQQQEMAERIGMAPVVYGRIELGTRPVRATELHAIARVLGTSTDDLLNAVRPVTADQMVERAAARRDAAATSLREYAAAVLDAIAAVQDEPNGALVGDEQITDADELVEWLRTSRPHYTGITAPDAVVAAVHRAVEDIASALLIYPRRGDTDG